jgi:hypothetical protein
MKRLIQLVALLMLGGLLGYTVHRLSASGADQRATALTTTAAPSPSAAPEPDNSTSTLMLAHAHDDSASRDSLPSERAPAMPVRSHGSGSVGDAQISTGDAPGTTESRDGSSRENTDDGEPQPLYWCFRSFQPGRGWLPRDSEQPENRVRSETGDFVAGARSARMDSVRAGRTDTVTGIGGVVFHHNILFQAIRAEPFRGTRIEVSAHVRLKRGPNLIQFFIATQSGPVTDIELKERPTRVTNAAFYNLRAEDAWHRVVLVIDVPIDADMLQIGFLNHGQTSLLIDNVQITAAPFRPLSNWPWFEWNLPDVPVDPAAVWKTPMNLDFELVGDRTDGASHEVASEGHC